jgi:hypothetical protein
MNTLEAVRDAQQMWEWRFQNAGRERIVLSGGKRGGLREMLGRIFHSVGAKPAANRGGVGVPAQKRHATA